MQDNKNTDQSIMIPEEIRLFLEGVLQEADMQTLDQDVHDAMIQELFVRLDKFILTKIVEYIPDDKLDQFVSLNKSNPSSEKIFEYLQTNVPNPQEVLLTAFNDFRKMYLGSVDTSRKIQQTEKHETLENIASMQ